MVRTVTLKLQDWRLPVQSSPNRGGHWSKKADARRTLRDLGWGLVKQHGHGWTFERARITVTLRVCRKIGAGRGYRPLDEDNALAALKGFFDGIVAARLVPDDAAKYVTQGGVTIEAVPHPRREGLLVTVEELEQ